MAEKLVAKYVCLIGVFSMFLAGVVPVKGDVEPLTAQPWNADFNNPPFVLVNGEKIEVQSLISDKNCISYSMIIELYNPYNYLKRRWTYFLPGKIVDSYSLSPSDPTGTWKIWYSYQDSGSPPDCGMSYQGYKYARVLKWVDKKPVDQDGKPNTPNLQDPGYTFDPDTGKMILFGGCSKGVGSSLVYTYSFLTNKWENRSIPNPPGKRWGAKIVYHSDRKLVIMFGGAIGANGECNDKIKYGDTWSYNVATNTWTQLQPQCDPTYGCPSPRYDHGMVYNAAEKEILVFSGNPDRDTYTWILYYDPGIAKWKWVRRSPSPSPEARDGSTMAYDSFAGASSLYGGQANVPTNNNIWRYRKSFGWDKIQPTGGPQPQAPDLPEFVFSGDDKSYVAGAAASYFYVTSYTNFMDSWSSRSFVPGGAPFAAVYDTTNHVYIFVVSSQTWALQL